MLCIFNGYVKFDEKSFGIRIESYLDSSFNAFSPEEIQEKLGINNKSEVYGAASFKSRKSDELSFEVNDLLIILRKGDDDSERWWAKMKETGNEGFVPRNLLAVSGIYVAVSLITCGTNLEKFTRLVLI